MNYLTAKQVKELAGYENMLACYLYTDASLDEVQQAYCQCLDAGVEREQLEILNTEKGVTL